MQAFPQVLDAVSGAAVLQCKLTDLDRVQPTVQQAVDQVASMDLHQVGLFIQVAHAGEVHTCGGTRGLVLAVRCFHGN
jgi:hypothetical protein